MVIRVAVTVVIVVWQAPNLHLVLIFVFEFQDVTTDHDKGDGKVQEDPDGGHHDIDAPPRPLNNQHNENAIHPEV